MKVWLKTGFATAFLALIISGAVFSAFDIEFFKDVNGNSIPGIELFYILVIVSISFFSGIIVGIFVDRKAEDKTDYYAKIFLIFFNGIAFFLVLGFAFSLQIWRISLNNSYTLKAILGFIVGGIMITFLVFVLSRKNLIYKR